MDDFLFSKKISYMYSLTTLKVYNCYFSDQKFTCIFGHKSCLRKTKVCFK